MPGNDFLQQQDGANDQDWVWSMALYEHLCSLSRDDPQKFEQERARLIEEFISRSSNQKLRWLQMRIDFMRRHTHSPLKVCINLSNMMWQSVDDMKRRLIELRDNE
ncbi:MAG TPA: DUF3135 domain-containing protein [Nitrospira sp.]|nr:DUF3135 domain-containing protein [Anaerolineales bacterium]HNE34757.1 DUF3135 domain-containing protein [Nitrospira sp.]HNP42010.1 DUF3135 domain-containing protein [Nitrospira sp.]